MPPTTETTPMHAHLAHAFGQRYGLPVPVTLFVVGGAAVVVLSFLLVLRRRVESRPVGGSDLPPGEPFAQVWGSVAVLLLLLVALTGLAGSQEVASNLAPTTFWVIVWIGVPLSVGLVGDWTRRLNPFANLARLGSRPSLRRAVLARDTPLPWSRAVGSWPAVVLFALLVVGELVYNQTTTKPAVLGGLLLVYAVANLVLGMLYGPVWEERGEVFTVLFNVWGRLGFWRFDNPGRQGFGGGLEVPFDASPSRIVFVLLMLVNINFDGLAATRRWADLQNRLKLDGTSDQSVYLFKDAALVLLVLSILVLFGVFALASARAGRHGTSFLVSLAGLLPSLVPIAFGYLIAHYTSYLLINAQDMTRLLGNPGAWSWWPHLPGPFSSSFEADATFLPPAFYWYVSLTAIVLAHVAAVVLAHRHLSQTATGEHEARRSEYPWLVAMVAYTVFSLLLIAATETSDASSGGNAALARPAVTSTLS